MHHINENHEVDGNNNRVPQTQCNTPARSTQSSKDKEDGSISAGVGSKGGWFRVPNWPVAKKLIGWGAAAVALIMILYYLLKEDEKDNACTAEANQYKSQRESDGTLDTTKTDNDIRQHHQKTADEIQKGHEQTDDKLRVIQAESEAKIAIERVKHEMRTEGKLAAKSASSVTYTDGPSWDKQFYQKHKKEIASCRHLLPDLYDELLCSLPEEYTIPMILHLDGIMGAYAFSSCRAEYHTQLQAPIIMNVIEAISGCGKGAFNLMYKMLVGHIIEEERNKLQDEKKHIIQGIGTSVTAQNLIGRQMANKGVHTYMFVPEIDQFASWFTTKNIDKSLLRIAGDGDNISYAPRGVYKGEVPVMLNLTLTGASKAVDKFFKNEVESGTASRFCLALLPKVKKEDWPFTQQDIDCYRDYISRQREQFCFHTDANGVDIPAKIKKLDLRYVQTALDEWRAKQQRCKNNPCRQILSDRYATLAFHHAIVQHMAFENPMTGSAHTITEEEKAAVVSWTLLIATYCFERFVHKYGEEYNMEVDETEEKEMVKHLSSATKEEIRRLHSEEGLGYKAIAKRLKISKGQVANVFRKRK